ncbi:MAG: transcription-repair coupling factor [Dehalococcoidia bacterium]|uniref:transcription-repair coupling factor n=1 Tax=Candidatus Amarobacter glycogenicus TaxID=3140699 RepID=UPI003135E1A9|nr:transcription-repair coupling factor [Dehalococcoidia bacterium]
MRFGEGVLRLGLPESARAPVAAALASGHPAPVLVVVGTPAKSHTLYEELAMFVSGIPLARLPEREALPYEFARDDPGIAVERSHALGLLRNASPAVVVASWAALSEHCAGPEVEEEGLTLTTGASHNPGALMTELERAGYAIEPLADAPGTASRRGGIIDVFPAGAERPFRVEFFGDEVESIRELDLVSQRSVSRLEQLHVPPAATSSSEAREAARTLLAEIEANGDQAEVIQEQLGLLAEGNRSPFAAFFEPLLYTETAASHLAPGALVVFDEPADGATALAVAVEHELRTRAELEGRGLIPTGLPPLRVGPEALRDALSNFQEVDLQRFGSEELGARRLPMAVTPSFAGKLRPLAQQAGAWAKQGRAIAIVSQQALRLAELLDDEGIRAEPRRRLTVAPNAGEIVLTPAALAGGFTLGESLTVISDSEVFGLRKRRRPTRNRASIRADLVSTLEIGDYLVHADHGIARYAGLVRRSVDGVEREYLELQYADRDRLYVPADQLESVSRYVGPTDHPPSLTKLGSQEWARAKRRVKQAVVELAQELLELYAKRELARGHAFGADNAWQMEMEAAFPFVETQDQLDAISEVKADMENTKPMDRLICGDVGYGKTEVAVRAAFKAVMDGKQVAVLVPTTVLAEQHGNTFRERVQGFPVRVEVLSRFRNEHQQREIVGGINSGEVDIAIGTHRLVQKDVAFKDLGLVIIDEEQRFGVSHKERLKQMRSEVDSLVLSATPIPRTLQMSLVGIRDMSTVMTPPEERQPIRTYVLQWDDELLREAIDREMQRGGQVYFVHNRVHNIERIVTRLQTIVPDARIAVGHGQMPEEQLERVMMEFGAGEHDILVCTTIIESGLDIPNANTIIINDANTLGLAQLYQLRGRVGRSANRAYAYLLYDKDRTMSETAQKRLEAIFEATELGAGFQIALRDLEIRGAGNVLGTEQSGHIAAVGFDMYSKLVAEAVSALKKVVTPDAPAGPEPLPPPPLIDLPLSAHIPESYVPDIHGRLAAYQKIAEITSAEGVAEMQAELADRFGPVPRSVENLLYVALVRSMARRANVESLKTDEQMFHLRIRGGTTLETRSAVEALRLKSVITGPNQVRIDRIGAGTNWMPLVARVLRVMVEAAAK